MWDTRHPQVCSRASKERSVKAMDAAAAKGDIDIVRFLHQHRTEGCTTNAMDGAASNGHLSVLQFLHKHRKEGATTATMDVAAKNGLLYIVLFLHENRTEDCTTDVMDNAPWNNRLSIVKFLHENRKEGCTKRAMDTAILMGHLTTVRFLHEYRTEGYHEAVVEKGLDNEPDDWGLVLRYLAPELANSEKARRSLQIQRKYDRMCRTGRFSQEQRALQDEEDYDSGNESDAWENSCGCLDC